MVDTVVYRWEAEGFFEVDAPAGEVLGKGRLFCSRGDRRVKQSVKFGVYQFINASWKM